MSGPVVLVSVVVVGWAFGLFVLFKTKNWDALTNRLPLAICALVLVQVGLSTIVSSGALESVLGVAAMAVLLAGTVLPALSGVILWMRRRSPERFWAAHQLTYGRVLSPAVSTSLVDGVIGGAAIAGLGVLGDWGALGIDGFLPSISREVNVVDSGLAAMVGDALGAASFIALGIGLVVETLDRLRVRPIVSTVIVAIAAGLVAAADQKSMLAGLPLIGGLAAGAAIAALLYRRRGLLATWVACLVAGLMTEAMAARSLEDPDLLRLSNLVMSIAGALFVLGAWGIATRRFLKTPVEVAPR